MDVSLHAVGGRNSLRSVVLHSKSASALESRIVGIGRQRREGLIYLSESDNFLEGTVAVTASKSSDIKTLSKWVDYRDCPAALTAAKLDSLRRSHHNFRRFPSGAQAASINWFRVRSAASVARSQRFCFPIMRHEPSA